MARNLVWILGGGTIAAAAAVAVWITAGMQGSVMPPANAPANAPAAPAGSAPVASGASASAPSASAAATPETPAAPATTAEVAAVAPPSFDVVRVARDGEALVAGTAAPGSAVTLRVDGAVVAEAAADSSGQFVAMFSLGSSDAVQVMTLDMADAEGAVIAAEDTVILTPRPVQVAALETPAEPVAAETGTSESAAAGPGAAAEGDTTQMAEETSGLAGETAAPEEPASSVSADAGGAEATTVAGAEAEGASGAPAQGTEVASVDGPAEGAAAPAAPDESTTAVAGSTGAGPAAQPAGTEGAADSDAETQIALAAPEAPAEPAASSTAEMPTAFLLRGDGEVEVLDRAPNVMDNVVIDTISYSEAGDVQISGRAAGTSPQADLRIYLDNRPVAVAQAERGDWRLDLPAVDPGIYTLRVDQLTPEGRVESRFETPFQREAPEVIAAARARAAGGNTPEQAAVAAPAQPETVAEGTDTPTAAASTDGAGAVPPVAAPETAAPETAPTETASAETTTTGNTAASPEAAAPASSLTTDLANAGTGPAENLASEGSGSTEPRTLPSVASRAEPAASGSASTAAGGAVAGTSATAATPSGATASADAGASAGSSAPEAGAPAATASAGNGAATRASAGSSTSGSASGSGTSAAASSGTATSAGSSTSGPGAGVTVAATTQSGGTEASAPASGTGNGGASATASASAQGASGSGSSGTASESASAGGSSSGSTTSGTASAAPRVALITVQPGHTLWHISQQRYGAGERYVIIYRANRSQIRDPDLIYPGQVFTLPEN